MAQLMLIHFSACLASFEIMMAKINHNTDRDLTKKCNGLSALGPNASEKLRRTASLTCINKVAI